jgi:branched-chain amino acid transport system substrate-binding protein
VRKIQSHKRLVRLFAVLAIVALIGAACSSDSDDTTTTTAAASGGDATTTTAAASGGDATTTTAAASGGTDVIKLGILSDCEGPFGGFHEADLAGVGAAMAEFAGATVTNPENSVDGFTGATVNGVPIELVGIGCGDATPDLALSETRRLMEQLGADIMIGPLSGDEAIAVANYAKDHPEQTFVNGTAGSQDPTMHVQAPNFFRYNSDGAQWNVGTGFVAKDVLGWDNAAIIMDDYSFAWTSAAGMIAEFCAMGGTIDSRVFVPLGVTDYSTYMQQLPDLDEVDGYFWVLGEDTIGAYKAFEDAKGPVTADKHIGNLFTEFVWGDLDPALTTDMYIGGFGTAGDVVLPSVDEHTAIITKHYTTIGGSEAATQAHNGFLVNYYTATKGLLEGLALVDGDISDNTVLWAAMSDNVIDGPYGPIPLDENRQAIQDQYVRQIRIGDSGELELQTAYIVPNVDQGLAGTFSSDLPPPGRDVPECVTKDLPWLEGIQTVTDGVPTG